MIFRKTLPKRFADADLSQLDESFGCVQEYAKALPDHFRRGRGLLLSGSNGIGKSFAIAALTNAAVSGVTYVRDDQTRRWSLKDFIYLTWPEVCDLYAPTFNIGEEKDLTDVLETVPWLVLNDLGKEPRFGKMESVATYKVGRLLRARVEQCLVTHVTSNLVFEADAESQGASMQEVYGPSVLSLLFESCPMRFELNGPDRRRG